METKSFLFGIMGLYTETNRDNQHYSLNFVFLREKNKRVHAVLSTIKFVYCYVFFCLLCPNSIFKVCTINYLS